MRRRRILGRLHLALRPGRLPRRVLAARAVQAHAAPPEKELARRSPWSPAPPAASAAPWPGGSPREGAHVVVTDLDAAGARRVAEEVAAERGTRAGPRPRDGRDLRGHGRGRVGRDGRRVRRPGRRASPTPASRTARPIDAMALADWERSFAVNATGPLPRDPRGAAGNEGAGLGGSIVFVATKNVMAPGKDFAAYSASKAAEAQLARVAALEGGRARHPGEHGESRRDLRRLGPLVAGGARGARARPGRRRRRDGGLLPQAQPPRRRGLPEDVAEAVLFLASDRSAKTTGSMLPVDGGVRDAFPGERGRATGPPDADPVRRRAAASPELLGPAAAAAEALGFDSVWIRRSRGDPPADARPAGGAELPGGADAGACGSGRACTSSRCRHPTIAAKAVATLDVLSGGRVVFGVGSGASSRRSSRRPGAPPERGARVDEAIAVCRALWGLSPVSFAGRFTRFTDVVAEPRPVQTGGPPIWIGGRSDAALRRAARVGDGWIAYLVTPERFRTSIEKIRAFAHELGRPLDPERSFEPAHVLFTVVDEDPAAARTTAARYLEAQYSSHSTIWPGSTACSDPPRPARSGLRTSSRPARGRS